MLKKSLTDIEIKEQYNNGFVELSPMIESLIVKFQNDKTSINMQQLQLVTTYLIAEREFDEDYIDELEQEIERLKESE